MATTYNHAQIGIVDASGNVNVIYPMTRGADVSITRTNTKLPTTATTAQKLADSLGKLAFLDSQINDSATSTTSTWSSNLINTKLTELNSNQPSFIIDGTSGEITGYKTEIGGADTVFPFKKSNLPDTIIMKIHGSGKGQACPSATVQTLGYKYVSFNGGYRVLQVRNTSSTGSLLSAVSGTKYNIEPYTQIYIWMEGPTGNSNYTEWFDASLTFTNI